MALLDNSFDLDIATQLIQVVNTAGIFGKKSFNNLHRMNNWILYRLCQWIAWGILNKWPLVYLSCILYIIPKSSLPAQWCIIHWVPLLPLVKLCFSLKLSLKLFMNANLCKKFVSSFFLTSNTNYWDRGTVVGLVQFKIPILKAIIEMSANFLYHRQSVLIE